MRSSDPTANGVGAESVLGYDSNEFGEWLKVHEKKTVIPKIEPKR